MTIGKKRSEEDARTAYVRCPETITSPAPNPASGFAPNMKCGIRVSVVNPAPLMEFRCSRGHRFFASEDDVIRSEP